jgi:hypothetical protein
MENPRLSFLTPSLLAGDRSLVATVAHELAHSWTGNLVSNANAEHFWLNEGCATYAERRITEALWGAEVAALDWALGRRELGEAINRFEKKGSFHLTRLRTQLEGVDPDETYSIVPYEKGALFLRALEEAVGRPAFDAFIRRYIDRFRFGVLTTEEFVDFLGQQLPAAVARVSPDSWLYETGVPASISPARSSRLDAIAALNGQPPSADQARTWSAIEWQLFLESVPQPAPATDLAELDRRFALTNSKNYDVLEKWLVLAIRSDYRDAFRRVEDVLATVGRMKYLRALYTALAERDAACARDIFRRNADQYHPIARQVIADILN